MSEFPYNEINDISKHLSLDFGGTELANIASNENLSEEQLSAILFILRHLDSKKKETVRTTLLRLSHLPQKNPKTFENFDFSVVNGDVEKLQNLKTLASIHAHKNLAFIGPSGTGKTHLAQAFGYECCMNGIKAYFIKMTELRDKFVLARRTGREKTVLEGLVRPGCLIIDEVGHCEFDKECTRLFFDLIDRRYNKEGVFNIVFTSNKKPNLWRENFHEDDALLCALDRLFDDAAVFNLEGESYRGKRLEKYTIKTGAVMAPGISIELKE